jgi:hypothetical protein
MTKEEIRVKEARDNDVPWKDCAPYLTERQWGSVREDYRESGNAWDWFAQEGARSHEYRFGDDGVARLSGDERTHSQVLRSVSAYRERRRYEKDNQ